MNAFKNYLYTGVWADARGIFGAIMQAGMQGFPQPPTGPRRVRVRRAAAASR